MTTLPCHRLLGMLFLCFLLKPRCLLNAWATCDLLLLLLLLLPVLIACASRRAPGGTSDTATPLQPEGASSELHALALL